MINCLLISDKDSKICIFENRFSMDELLYELNSKQQYELELNRLKSETRKREFLAIRLALKMALKGEEKKIIYTDDGKPMLDDDSLKISISHCQSHVAVMIHPRLEVGVDIELPSSKLERIHRRFLGKEELEFYNTSQSFDFLRVAWSVKEALYKIIGERAYNFAEQLHILPFEIAESGALDAIHTDTNKTYKVYYMLTEQYTLAYCTDYE